MLKRQLALIAVTAGFVGAAMSATLSWQLPTTRVNGQSLAASEITQVTIYKQGATAPVVTLPGSALTYSVPDCVAATYYATVTAGMESGPSVSAIWQVPVSCAPNPPTAVTVK